MFDDVIDFDKNTRTLQATFHGFYKKSGHFCSIISVEFEKIPITPDISVFIGDYINNTTFTRLSSVCIVIFVIFVIFLESTRSRLGY